MIETETNQIKAAKDKLDSHTSDEQKRKSVQYIRKEAEFLQKIAAEHGYDFLSYILKMAILEIETILGKRDMNLEEPHIEVDKGATAIC